MSRSLREISGETCQPGEAGRSQSPHSAAGLKSRTGRNGWETGVMLGCIPWSLNSCRGRPERAGKQNRSEGRRTGRWKRERHNEANTSGASDRKG